MSNIIYLQEVKSSLDKVSKSFCIAKWKQVTMHLHNGHTHSCHHPRSHNVPIEELKENPSALHNSNFKKSQRKLMLEGERPKECDYCWRIEDQNIDYSDRILKSSEYWAYPYLEEIKSKSYYDNVDPTYVEVSFSNVCNFKCSYCNSASSSQWLEEIKKHGPYPTTDNYNNLEWIENQKLLPIMNKEHNPYVEAFWKWWPDLYKNLKYFRITGGEPLLSKNTFEILDYIIANPNPEIEIAINTNLHPPEDIFDKFLEKLKIINKEKKVKNIKIFTSVDSYGKHAEYIRYGLNYDTWINNLKYAFDTVDNMQVTIMSTYNILSIPLYKKLLEDVLYFKQKYGKENTRPAMTISMPYLRFPEHQAIFIGTEDLTKYIEEQVKFIENNAESKYRKNDGFYKHELDHINRIYNLYNDKKNDNKVLINRKNFVSFVDEHDRRRQTNFLETFPELENFYNFCKRN